MSAIKRELRVYADRAGVVPFTRWLDALSDRNAAAKVRVRLARARLGNLGRRRFVGSGVWEFKIEHGPGYRIYFAEIDCEKLLLLYGGDKRSQERDIERAKGFWTDYKDRARR